MFHTCPAIHSHIATVGHRAVFRAAEYFDQDSSELLAKGTVDEKVCGGVENLQNIAEFSQVEFQSVTIMLLVPPDNLNDPRWCLTQHEDQDNNDHDQRDVVVLVSAKIHAGSFCLDLSIGQSQASVEHRKYEQWQHEAEDVVKYIEVNEFVNGTHAQSRHMVMKGSRVIGISRQGDIRFKESRDIVSN